MIKTFFLTSLAGLFLATFSCIETPKQENNKVLLQLMNKRLEVAPLVAKSKWNTKAPINDSIREKTILDSVEARASRMGLDKHFARDFFQAQFEAGKKVQTQLHEKWKKEAQPPFDPAINLATEVRPVLDSLTPLLLVELKKIQLANNKQSFENFKKSARNIIHTEFDDNVVEIAIKPIKSHLK
jgi:chorismate mutase